MRALIDGDVLVYQASFVGQMKTDTGEIYVAPFDKVIDYLNHVVSVILDASWSDNEPPIFFFTYDSDLHKRYTKEGRRLFEGVHKEFDTQANFFDNTSFDYYIGKPYVDNFRVAEAKTEEYKGNRQSERPVHYYNTRAYMLDRYDSIIIPGIEADDAMAMYQHKAYEALGVKATPDNAPTVICSIDKDLRMVPGYHYGWGTNNVLETPLKFVTELGSLTMPDKKLRGDGGLFFYSQMLTGDAVDNIPGVPRYGPVAAYKALGECSTLQEANSVVKNIYKESFGEGAKEMFVEQARLLWMVREYNKDGFLLGHNGDPYPYKIERPITFWRK